MNRKEVQPKLLDQLIGVLNHWPEIQIAVLFGSLAKGRARSTSDLDLALQMPRALTTEQRVALISELAVSVGRPVDIIDLREIGQPLLGEIIAEGVMVKGSVQDWGDLVFKSIMLQEDFAPYQKLVLEGRRKTWLEQ